MTPSQTRIVRTALVCVPVLFLAIATTQRRIDAQTQVIAPEKDLLLRSGPLIKRMSLGYDPLLADIYWTRAVQYYGQRVGTPGNKFELLWPLLDITTTLDPRLVVAYRFGAIFLSEPEAGANRTDLAIELVKRGIAANPKEWHLGTDLGFLYYWWMKDYSHASAAYLEASKNPNAPVWIRLMAARIAQTGGSFETSRMLWSQLYESTNNANVKKIAVQALQGLRAQEDEGRLDMLAEEYRKSFGHFPATVQDMLAAGLLKGIPVDPSGVPYVMRPDGKSRLDPASSVVIGAPGKNRPIQP
jgi:hypothetical protein